MERGLDARFKDDSSDDLVLRLELWNRFGWIMLAE